MKPLSSFKKAVLAVLALLAALYFNSACAKPTTLPKENYSTPTAAVVYESPTPYPTLTATPTATYTPTLTATPTATYTPTLTPTPTPYPNTIKSIIIIDLLKEVDSDTLDVLRKSFELVEYYTSFDEVEQKRTSELSQQIVFIVAHGNGVTVGGFEAEELNNVLSKVSNSWVFFDSCYTNEDLLNQLESIRGVYGWGGVTPIIYFSTFLEMYNPRSTLYMQLNGENSNTILTYFIEPVSQCRPDPNDPLSIEEYLCVTGKYAEIEHKIIQTRVEKSQPKGIYFPRPN